VFNDALRNTRCGSAVILAIPRARSTPFGCSISGMLLRCRLSSRSRFRLVSVLSCSCLLGGVPLHALYEVVCIFSSVVYVAHRRIFQYVCCVVDSLNCLQDIRMLRVVAHTIWVDISHYLQMGALNSRLIDGPAHVQDCVVVKGVERQYSSDLVPSAARRRGRGPR